ncbi:MAG: DUF6125 family protein [Bacillota bacterium]
MRRNDRVGVFQLKLESQKLLASLSKEELIAMVLDFAKRWLAHDGLWFQTIEEKHGLDEAVAVDAAAWGKFAAVEARRIMDLHGISPNGGLAALKKALRLRQYSFLTEQEIIDEAPERFIFRMNTCRVQITRKRKGLADFPCKPVGIAEFTSFAQAIDPRINVRCLTCPPDEHPENYFCVWEFRLQEGSTSKTE